MSKSKIATKEVLENGDVKFCFANQETRVIAFADFNAAVQAKIIGYGISQKFGDSFAGCAGDVDEAIKALEATHAKLSGEDGVWITKRAGSGGSRSATLIVEAVSRYKECSVGDAAELLDGLDDTQIKQVRGTPEMQNIINQIKAERSAAKVSNAGADANEALSLI